MTDSEIPIQPTGHVSMPTIPQQPYNLPMSPSAPNLGENRTASLLSLLKFSQAVPASSSPSPEKALVAVPQSVPTPPRPSVNSPAPNSQPPHGRSISTNDLVASLLGRAPGESKNSSKENIVPSSSASSVQRHTPPVQRSPAQKRSPALQRSATESASQRAKSPVNPQDLVFQLLGRQKPVQQEDPSNTQLETQTQPQSTVPEHELTREGSSQNDDLTPASQPHAPPLSVNSSPPTRAAPPTPVEAQFPAAQPPSKGLFTYVNPFDQLSASSPRNRPSKSSTPGPGASRRSGLGIGEIRAESVPLPSSTDASPPVPLEAQVAKDSASLEQVKPKEQQLLDQLGQHAGEYSPRPSEVPSHDGGLPAQSVESQPLARGHNAENSDVNGIQQATDLKCHEKRDGEEGYESAQESQPIEVYNFPMKPFSSITIIPSLIKRPKYPQAKISDIARMNRPSDQLDRNLISATHTYIAYSMSKSNGRGGIRIIRQSDGKARVLLKDTTDRTFNVTVGKGERVLGTGISGAVVWVDLTDDFETDNWSSMFVFPPSEEQGQSNGVLKSRARKTSRQIDTFAIGRGKTISIIHAPAAKAYSQGREGNEVASKKYLADHSRTIDTGKASKDFAFSDDDTVIVSIDKAGKLKLWDVRELLNFSDNDAYSPTQQTYPPQPPMVLSTPTSVFSAVYPGDPYRATSVMFLDKFRPYMKSLALRYVLVGVNQNHTLELWDLGLGRPVQEMNFPQESDTGALCSVVYHPLSGIIVVGNPTRNSIYFIHLSAPKYNVPPMSQAQYINGLASGNSNIPKPDATAILSGLREYSFASQGQLISVDILDCECNPQDEDPTLFELYVAHSKGMTSLSVFKEDLGWESDNRVKNAVDAVARGVCTMAYIPPPIYPYEKEQDNKSENTETSNQGPKSKSGGDKSRSISPPTKASVKSDAREDKAAANGTNSGKKKKRDKSSMVMPAAVSGTDEPEWEIPATKAKSPTPVVQNGEQSPTLSLSPEILDREVKKFENTVSLELNKVISQELEKLYKRFDEDKRIQQAAGDAKQDAILRLLSTTLTENVEKVISQIVMSNIQSQVVPAISNVTATSIDRALGDTMNRTLLASLPRELRSILPEAIGRTLTQPEMLNRISESLSHPLTQAVEREFSHCLHATVIPAFQKLAVETAQKAVIETERKQKETITALEQMHLNDSRKIDQLMATVKQLSETMTIMAKSQADFQEQVQQAQAEYYEQSPQPQPQQQSQEQTMPKSQEQLEAEDIENLLRSGKYEDGTIKWLQSKERQAELFDELMVRYRYDFLPNLSQLVLLSVSAAVSVKFEHKVMERLSWLEGVLAVLDPMDPEIHEICNRIMVVVVQRLEQLYMSIAEVDSQTPVLRKIPAIAKRARELSSMSPRG